LKVLPAKVGEMAEAIGDALSSMSVSVTELGLVQPNNQAGRDIHEQHTRIFRNIQE